MKKLFILLLSVSFAAAVIIFSSGSVFADHQMDVLGVASAPTLSIPPTAEGPGLVLPNSPLFFIDSLKQEFRLLLAFTPEQKAKIHNAIAGERLAELRIMLIKNNVPGIRIALQGVSDNLRGAAEDVTNAKLTGRNINLLAKEINDSIKEKQKVLTDLIPQATGEIKIQVAAAREALKTAKVQVEENLPVNLLMNETIDDLNQLITENIDKASFSAAEINRVIGVLTRLGSESVGQNKTFQDVSTHIVDIKNLINEFQKTSSSLQKVTPAATAGAKPVKK